MICNLKTDSKSEFGGPDTAEERERSARGARLANGQPWWPRVEAVCHTARGALCPHVPHASHTWLVMWHSSIGCFLSLSLSFKKHFPSLQTQLEEN